MTTLPPDHTAAGPALVPPPGCPAHAAGAGGHLPTAASLGVTPLYGPVAEADPMGLYEQLRAQHGPVAPVLLDGGVPAWLVLGYRENVEVTRAPTRFSRDPRLWRDWQEGRIAPDSPLLPMMGWRPDCVSADGQEHQRLRAAVTESLGQFDRRGIRRHVQRYANQLIDDFCADGSTELLARYAQHVPMLVLTHLFGLPEETGPDLVEASAALIKGNEKAVSGNQFILDTLRQLVEDKHANPGRDFASALIGHPAELTDEEVQHHLRLVMLATNETTTNLIANTLRMVLTDSRFHASLTGGLMTVSEAVEQVLWDEPPLMVCPGRWATSDTELADRHIKAGDLLLLGLAAGNVDPAVRPDPTARLHGNRSHLAFSRGPHECPGQDIGRAITDSAVETLLTRLPDVQLAVPEAELSWTSSTWARHLNALPVQFAAEQPTPGRPAAAREPAPAPAPAPVPVAAPAAVEQEARVPQHASSWGWLTGWLRRR
ncbi:cytochrome P450 [Kitasatospora sp. NPDC056138]|uniref:cytochrome P450 n=1 Tax=Kitasatospora sp. NPDC056138 TaxID=3345724 RepID=UPI0035E1F176